MTERIQVLSFDIPAPDSMSFVDKCAPFPLELPVGSEVFLVAQKPHGAVRLWARTGDTHGMEQRIYVYALDGAWIDPSWRFIGLVQRQVKAYLLYEMP